jgi:outer membrane protein OmpA-like peptidoglycan-associated protein
MISGPIVRKAPPSIKGSAFAADSGRAGRYAAYGHHQAIEVLQAHWQSAQVVTYIQPREEQMRRRLRRWHTAGTLLPVLFLFLLLLAACGRPPGTARVFVVVGSGTRNEPAVVLAPPDRAELSHAGAASSDAIAYVVDPQTGQSAKVSLTPRRPDGQVEYGPRRAQLLGGNVDRVQRLLGQEPADTPFDLLSLMAAAVRVTSTPGTLIVVSSGLSTAGGFDLRQVGWGASPRAVAVQLKDRGLLPPLAGWHVVFSGLANATAPQPALPLPQRAELTAYWLAICHAAGAASCRTDEVTRPDPPPLSTTPVPVVPIPVVRSVVGPHHRGGGVIVPVDTFFAFNSSRLLPGANSILEPLAQRAISRHLKVSITGYASPDGGSNAYNKALSLARAMSIRARLISLGVAASQIVKVAGDGTGGKTASACYRNGHLDETICARLRRVVILLSPATGSNS